MKNKIDALREELYKEISANKVDYQEILRISKALDDLIVEYHKENKIDDEEPTDKS